MGKKKHKHRNKQYKIKLFTDTVNDAINFFGLHDFDFHIRGQIKESARASIYHHSIADDPDSNGRIFTICYSLDWIEGQLLTDDEIVKTAWHEVFESMFYRLRDFSLNTKFTVHEREVDSEIHKIVRIFENKILPLVIIHP